MLQPLLHVFSLFLHPIWCYLVIHIIGAFYTSLLLEMATAPMQFIRLKGLTTRIANLAIDQAIRAMTRTLPLR
jgi:hypothetical protein